MRRKLFGFSALLSLLFCVATVGLWVHSYWTIASHPLWGRDGQGVFSHDGAIVLFFWRGRQGPFFGQSGDWYWHGFGFVNRQAWFLITMPHWSIVFISAIVPMVWSLNSESGRSSAFASGVDMISPATSAAFALNVVRW